MYLYPTFCRLEAHRRPASTTAVAKDEIITYQCAAASTTQKKKVDLLCRRTLNIHPGSQQHSPAQRRTSDRCPDSYPSLVVVTASSRCRQTNYSAYNISTTSSVCYPFLFNFQIASCQSRIVAR